MSFVRFNIDAGGTDKEVIRRLQNVESELSDFRRQNEKVYKQFWVPKMIRQFNSEGADGGQKWEALSADYAIQKRKRYGLKTILRRTDRLFRSLTSETGDTVKIIDKFSATFGSKVPYLAQVNKTRQVVSITDKDRRDIGNIFKRDLAEFTRKQGFAVTEGGF